MYNPLSFFIVICVLMMRNFWLHRKRKAEESADEARWVEAASSNPSVESPPRSRVRWEATVGEAEAEDTGRSAAQKPAPMGVVEVPPVPLSPPPQENPSRELFPARQDPVMPRAVMAEQ